MARPGGNPELENFVFTKPEGIEIARNKQFAIMVEPEIQKFLKEIDNEKIRKKFVEIAIEEGYQPSQSVIDYYEQF